MRPTSSAERPGSTGANAPRSSVIGSVAGDSSNGSVNAGSSVSMTRLCGVALEAGSTSSGVSNFDKSSSKDSACSGALGACGFAAGGVNSRSSALGRSGGRFSVNGSIVSCASGVA